MLGMKSYTRDYIAACRSRVDADLATYRKLAAAAKKQPAADKKLNAALQAFESTFFNNIVPRPHDRASWNAGPRRMHVPEGPAPDRAPVEKFPGHPRAAQRYS
jgi:hypothetical protein